MKTIVKIGVLAIIMMSGLFVHAQKKAKSFTVTRVINTSVDQVWAVVGEDFGGIANSHPKIISSNYISGTLQSGEGAERVCNFNESGSKYVKEKQVNYDPVNHSFTAQIFHAGGLPLDPAYSNALYKVEPINGNSCKLSVTVSIRTKPAFMGGLAKGKFKKTMEDYALAVEHYAKTGEAVNKDNFKEIKKQYKG